MEVEPAPRGEDSCFVEVIIGCLQCSMISYDIRQESFFDRLSCSSRKMNQLVLFDFWL